jgi:membrane-associated phospholipid phosphatase
MSAAIDGPITQALIRNAAQWFAAVPSLHGAYPVLLLFLALRDRGRSVVAGLAIYAATMWAATVILNQHYVIDLLAGVPLCILAWRFAGDGSQNANRVRSQKEEAGPELEVALRKF